VLSKIPEQTNGVIPSLRGISNFCPDVNSEIPRKLGMTITLGFMFLHERHHTMTTPILSLSAVTKSYVEPAGRLQVLEGINLAVQPGEIVLLEGPSGSGKTTLLQIAGGLLRADGGRVDLVGQEINTAPEDERTAARRRHLGFVFQHFHLLEALDVHDNVALGLRFRRQPVDEATITRMLELLGLHGKARKLPNDLSGGEKQRVAFARALVGAPSLLMADEPTSQLDSHAAGMVAELIETAVRQTGTAALIATHDTRLHCLTHRICKLKEGRIHE
jgi:ABC-type lipoprotein export system ATPase subunit